MTELSDVTLESFQRKTIRELAEFIEEQGIEQEILEKMKGKKHRTILSVLKHEVCIPAQRGCCNTKKERSPKS